MVMMLKPPSCLNGRVAIVTGANSGVGYCTALGLAKLGAHVFLACRDSERGKASAIKICAESGGKAQFVQLDLASPRSINSFATDFLKATGRCSILVCSAGVNSGGARLQQRTDGAAAHNMTFQVNFLGHFLLIHRLLKCLHNSASFQFTSRIVCLSSVMHHTVPSSAEIDWRRLASSSEAPAYSQSKLALHMLAYELNRRLRSRRIFCVPVNPGAVNSSIWRGSSDCVKAVARWAFLTPDIGAQPVLYAAASASIPYLDGSRIYLNPYVPLFEWAEKARDSWLPRPLAKLVIMLRLLESILAPISRSTGCCRICEPSRVALDPHGARKCYEDAAMMVGVSREVLEECKG